MTDFYHIFESPDKGYFQTIVHLLYTVNSICYNIFNSIGIVRRCQLYNLPFAKFRKCGFPCGFLASFYCYITIVQLFDGLCDCDVIMKKFSNGCGVGHLAIRQLRTVV